jgi:hypothetical protein
MDNNMSATEMVHLIISNEQTMRRNLKNSGTAAGKCLFEELFYK